MSDRYLTKSEIELALSIDGFQYISNNRNFNLRDALEKYWQNKSWSHICLAEARATLFLILKAIEAWQNSPYSISTEELNKYYEAFHSLYEWIMKYRYRKSFFESKKNLLNPVQFSNWSKEALKIAALPPTRKKNQLNMIAFA